jgi:hypothetical protein
MFRSECSRGTFSDYRFAVDAIEITIAENKLLSWIHFAVVMHTTNTITIGRPDAVRRFKKNGVPYNPTNAISDENAR